MYNDAIATIQITKKLPVHFRRKSSAQIKRDNHLEFKMQKIEQDQFWN